MTTPTPPKLPLKADLSPTGDSWWIESADGILLAETFTKESTRLTRTALTAHATGLLDEAVEVLDRTRRMWPTNDGYLGELSKDAAVLFSKIKAAQLQADSTPESGGGG